MGMMFESSACCRRASEMPRLQAADIVLPAAFDAAAQHTVNSGLGFPLWAFARLKPGISIAQAKLEMQPLFLHTKQWIPAEIRNDFDLEIRSVRDRQMHDSYQAAWAAAWRSFRGTADRVRQRCQSVLGARRGARGGKFAVRSALGASRIRLIRQALTEAVLLALAGAVLGCALAEGLLRVVCRHSAYRHPVSRQSAPRSSHYRIYPLRFASVRSPVRPMGRHREASRHSPHRALRQAGWPCPVSAPAGVSANRRERGLALMLRPSSPEFCQSSKAKPRDDCSERCHRACSAQLGAIPKRICRHLSSH